MKKLLIIKTGKSLKAITNKYGDFEELIISKAGIKTEEIILHSPFKNEAFPDINNIKGIIITGSHSMVTDNLPWLKNLSERLKYYLANYDIPILGICFGHQLLAKIYDGEVDYHSEGEEIGSKKISLTEAGINNILFQGFPAEFSSFLIHEQSVLKLPPKAKRLAYNKFENNQAFYLEDNIWGVQFHPEFTVEVMVEYILEKKDELLETGYEPDKLIQNLHRENLGEKLIKNFLKIVNK